MKSARQEILEKLRNVKQPVPEIPDFSEPVFHEIEEPLELAFKTNAEKVNSKVHLFSTEEEMLEELKLFLQDYNKNEIVCSEEIFREKLEKYAIDVSASSSFNQPLPVGITGCEFLIAHTGSVMVSSVQTGGRKLFVYPEIHLVIATKKQLTAYLENAYASIQNKYKDKLPSQITLITGPSRTADIEKTLTLGAHGPKELHVFLY